MRKEWAKHWQCDESVQKVEGKPWRNQELKRLEEALPRLRESQNRALLGFGLHSRDSPGVFYSGQFLLGPTSFFNFGQFYLGQVILRPVST